MTVPGTVFNETDQKALERHLARTLCHACEENPDHCGDAQGNEKRWQDYSMAASRLIELLEQTKSASVAVLTMAMARSLCESFYEDPSSPALKEGNTRLAEDYADIARTALKAHDDWMNQFLRGLE